MYVNAGLRISYEDEKHMLIKDMYHFLTILV